MSFSISLSSSSAASVTIAVPVISVVVQAVAEAASPAAVLPTYLSISSSIVVDEGGGVMAAIAVALVIINR